MIEAFSNHQALRGFTAATIKRRRWTLTTIARQIDPRDLTEVTLVDIETFLGARQAASTRRALLTDLRCFYRWACRRGLCETDPTVHVDSVKVPRRRPTPLTAGELATALLAADERMTLILLLGAHAGLRCGEIGRLEMRDVDLESGVLMVRGGKGGVDAPVPLSPALREVLHSRPDGPVVGLRPGTVGELVREHFRALGIRRRPHDLRHSFGTEAARVSGGNLPVVMALMRHSSVATTQGYVLGEDRGAAVVAEMYPRAAREAA